MKLYLFILMLFFSSVSLGQYSLNAELGIGGITPGYNDFIVNTCSAASFTAGITVLTPVTRNTELGAALYFQRYNYQNQSAGGLFTDPGPMTYEDCSYIFLAPAVEFWRRHDISLGLQPSIGLLLSGNENTEGNNTSDNIDKLVFQFNFVFRERTYISDARELTVSENVGYNFGGITRTAVDPGTPLYPIFLSLRVGALHRHN